LISRFVLLDKETTEAELYSLLNMDQVIFEGDSRSETKGWNLTALGTNLNWVAPRNPASSGASFAVINARAATVDSKIRTGKKNILVFWAGVNNSGNTAEQIHTYISDYCSARRAAGHMVAVCTEIDAQDASRNTNGWHAKYLDLNTLIRNNYSSYADALIDLGANAALQNALDTTYYTTDKVHLDQPGCQVVASIAAPILDTLLNS
jgi:hypothetical protein